MSVREERLVLAAAAMIAQGRDDRLNHAAMAKHCVERADELLSALDETEPEGDSDDYVAHESMSELASRKFEKGYEQGEKDAELRLERKHQEHIEALKKEHAVALASVNKAGAEPAKK